MSSQTNPRPIRSYETWNNLRALISLDSRRFLNNPVRRNKKRLYGSLALLFVLGLIAAERSRDPSLLFFISADVWLLGTIFIGLATATSVVYQSQTDWWLGFPVSRKVLVLAKWLTTIRMGAIWFGIVALLSISVYIVMWTMHLQSWFPTPDMLSQVAGLFFMVVVLLPVVSGFTLLLLGLMTGRARMLQPLVYILIWSSMGALPSLVYPGAESTHFAWTQILLWVMAIGWPLTAIFLSITIFRLPHLAGVVGRDGGRRSTGWRWEGPSGTSTRPESESGLDSKHGLDCELPGLGAKWPSSELPGLAWVNWYERLSQRNAPTWFVLLSLRASQLRFFGKGADVRLTVFSVLLPGVGFVIGGLLNNANLLVTVPAGLLFIAAWVALWTGLGVTQRSLRDTIAWELGYSVSRKVLIWTRIAAWFLRMGGLIAVTEAALWSGIGLRALISSMPSNLYDLAAGSTLRSVLLILIALPLLQAILYTAHLAFTGWQQLLMLPVYLSMGLLFPIGLNTLRRWVFANPLTGHLASSYWLLVIGVAAIGVPVVNWFITRAAANLYVMLTQRQWFR